MIDKMKFLFHFLKFATDPTNTPEVFRIIDSLRDGISPEQTVKLGELYMQDPDFKALYSSNKPEYLNRPYDLKSLAQHRPNTLGHQYAAAMLDKGFDPEFFEYLKVEDPVTYFATRIRKTHDIWHTVTGFGTDVPGELGLQGFYLGQFTSPAPVAIICSGLLFVIARKDLPLLKNTFDQIVAGYEAGQKAKPLAGVIWEDHWDRDLNELRQQFRIPVYDHELQRQQAS